MTTIQDALRPFGITRCYRRFKHTIFAIHLVLTDKARLDAVAKNIYMETASFFECEWTAVERNIRTVASRAWRVNPDLLCQMAGYPLTAPPTASEFIEIVSSYIIRTYPLPLPPLSFIQF